MKNEDYESDYSDLEKRKESISFALSHNFLEIGLVSIKGIYLLYVLEVHLSQYSQNI